MGKQRAWDKEGGKDNITMCCRDYCSGQGDSILPTCPEKGINVSRNFPPEGQELDNLHMSGCLSLLRIAPSSQALLSWLLYIREYCRTGCKTVHRRAVYLSLLEFPMTCTFLFLDKYWMTLLIVKIIYLSIPQVPVCGWMVSNHLCNFKNQILCTLFPQK